MRDMSRGHTLESPLIYLYLKTEKILTCVCVCIQLDTSTFCFIDAMLGSVFVRLCLRRMISHVHSFNCRQYYKLHLDTHSDGRSISV